MFKQAISYWQHLLAIAATIAVLLLAAACRIPEFPPTPTPITLPPTPTAIVLPATPTQIRLPATPTREPFPPTTAPGGGRTAGQLTTPEIVELLKPSVVQIAALTSQGRSVGTGIVYDLNGHVLTNWHVVSGAASIQVAFSDDTIVPATLFREDKSIDLAVISLQKDTLRPALLGDSSRLQVGEEVIAIGHALGLPGGPTVSKGVVSALGRSISDPEGTQLTGLIQTDAAINEGNSGGPLLNMHGEVIGLNTAKANEGYGIGFALNINDAKAAAARLISLGPLPPAGYLGAFGSDINRTIARMLGLPVSSGYGVEQVDPDSPAAEAGIQVDDVIVQMDDVPIRSGADLAEFLRTHQPGARVEVRAVRGDFFRGFYLIAFDVTLGGQSS